MKSLLRIFFLFAIHQVSFAQSQVQQVLTKQLAAWNAGDIDGFMDGYWKNDSLRFMTKSGVTKGWKPVLENYKKSFPTREKMGKLNFVILTEERLSPVSALITGKWEVETTEGTIIKKKEGYFSLLFRMVDHKWFIVLDHTS